MSELKEYLCVEALVPEKKEIPGYLMHMAKYRAPQAEMELVYLKSEADKVIAAKNKELRHNKYKRCLAMAERWLFAFYVTNKCNDKFYLRSLKYRELAEKFKGVK